MTEESNERSYTEILSGCFNDDRENYRGSKLEH